MSIRKHIPDDIRRASKAIGLAAWLDDPDAWINATVVIEARMEARERKALAFAALATLDEDQIDEVLNLVFGPPESEAAA